MMICFTSISTKIKPQYNLHGHGCNLRTLSQTQTYIKIKKTHYNKSKLIDIASKMLVGHHERESKWSEDMGR